MRADLSRRHRQARSRRSAARAVLVLLALSGCGREVAPQETPARPLERLSQYGLFGAAAADLEPGPGVIPYDLNSSLFSDYADKYRFIKLPAGTCATYREDDAFEFPVGTVIAKTFAFPTDARDRTQGRRLIETRILKHEPEGWIGLPYIWNKAQTDAVLDVAGDTVDVNWVHTDGRPRSDNYIIPNANQCKGCHKNGETVTPIGPKARHLNRDFAYSHGKENQLAYWSHVGALEGRSVSGPGSPAGRLGRPCQRHARCPCPRLARDQLRTVTTPPARPETPDSTCWHPSTTQPRSASGRRRWPPASAPAADPSISFPANPTNRS